MHDLVAPALQQSAIDHPAVRPSFTERYGDPAVQELRRGDLDLVIFEHDMNDTPPGGARLAATPLQDAPVRAFPHIDLGGRRIGALYAHYRGQASPAVRALLEVLTATAAGIGT